MVKPSKYVLDNILYMAIIRRGSMKSTVFSFSPRWSRRRAKKLQKQKKNFGKKTFADTRRPRFGERKQIFPSME